MNILILYVEVMPYNRPVFEELVKAGYSLKIVQLDKKKITPYRLPQTGGIDLSGKSSFASYGAFQEYCLSTNPVLIMVSEIMEKWYWRFAFHFRRLHKNVPVVLGSDAQWTGSVNNWIKRLTFTFTYRQCFTHILSAGIWQCVYALKIGFKRENILTPLYCADNELYNLVDIDNKRNKYPHRFVFVGRLTPVKGIRQILEAWRSVEDKSDWKLTIVGSGEMADEIRKIPDIELLPFSSQKEICEIMQQAGCALVPSLYEPWGLVIHEAAAAGMPIIATKRCGAVHQFVVNGCNGFLIKENDALELKDAMEKIIHSDEAKLLSMALNSRRLSSKITPNDVASALVSLIL
jgi:glycosyltransferase involved in cell wall biosynthesis